MKLEKLNLGCGNDYREGYLNCDWTNKIKIDLIVNLENPKLYLNFKENSIEEILAYHVLEHITNFIPLMHQLHKICIPGATIKIKTPFYSAWGQFNDPTHVRFFTPYTFNYFEAGNYSHEVGCDKNMFKVNKVKLNFGIGSSAKLNFLFNPLLNLSHKIYCRFFAWIFPCAEIEYVLECVK
jgi:hypothetical protein